MEVHGKQPPSGGCVLKRILPHPMLFVMAAAAFGRLCVETGRSLLALMIMSAAAFGRLCVETAQRGKNEIGMVAAAFGRLCVETA